MACGKSTIGRVLSKKLHRPFIDLDEWIETKIGCTIAELIKREGEERFRQIETETLRRSAQSELSVIAPGGGAITRAENRELMSQLGITVWLDAPFDLCWQRIKQDRVVRPLAPNEQAARLRYEPSLSVCFFRYFRLFRCFPSGSLTIYSSKNALNIKSTFFP